MLHQFFMPLPRPFLLQLSVSSSERACPPPAKTIIYIAALQRKHNHCFLWKTKQQSIIGAICFTSVLWLERPVKDGDVCVHVFLSLCVPARQETEVVTVLNLKTINSNTNCSGGEKKFGKIIFRYFCRHFFPKPVSFRLLAFANNASCINSSVIC